MKPKNFPARKLRRQLIAQGEDIKSHDEELEIARQIRSKKPRGRNERTITKQNMGNP